MVVLVSLSIPGEVRAGFLNSILNNSVYAGVFGVSNNSQTMPLLQANVSSVEVLKKKGDTDTTIDPTASVNIVSGNSLLATASPVSSAGGVGGLDVDDSYEAQTSFHVVRAGDTVSKVAEMYEISENTILRANELEKGAALKQGDILLILPFSGIEHTVVKGDTLKKIADKYKVNVGEILFANDISIDAELNVGDKLLVPGAETASEPAAPKPKSSNTSTKKIGKDSQPSVGSTSGYFKNPVPGARRTRGIKPGHMGVDLAAPTGTPIQAAAGGTVIISRMGYNGGFGNYVVIQHPNGTKTLYAHMSKLGTTVGEQVSQGEVIGYVGSTGQSTGPHLHIEVIGGKNPF